MKKIYYQLSILLLIFGVSPVVYGQYNVPFTGNNSITVCSGTIYDHAGSATNYSDYADGYTVINSSTPGNSVQLTGTIATESSYDFVYIYDGSGTGGTLLWSGSGSLTIPTVTSTSTSITVRFTSDVSIQAAGFALNITCVAPVLSVPYTGNNSYTVCSGNLYDHGGAGLDYTNNANGYTVLNPSTPGNLVQVSGTSGGETCCDWIRIYDGVGIGGTLLWSGNPGGGTIPLTTSSAGSLTVQFTSDVSVVGFGFSLAINCITPCSPPSDPGFGSNIWNVLGYNGQDINLGGGTTFRGYYTESSLSYNSSARWANTSSPSSASGYTGCTVASDAHTVVSKRTGVPTSGIYQVDIAANDDEYRFLVNGSKSFENSYCCLTHTGIHTGYFDGTTTFEMRHGEGAGASQQALTYTMQNLNATVTSSNPTSCSAPDGIISFTSPSGIVASPVFKSSFDNATGLTNYGNATVTGGYLQLTSNVNSEYGVSILTNATNTNASQFRAEFDFRVNDGGGADGFSFNYAPSYPGLPAYGNYENGIGGGLSVCFVTYSGAGGPFVRINYAGATVGADVGVTIRDVSFRQCIVSVNSNNEITVSINGVNVITNRALPSAFASTSKNSWQFAFAGRTGGVNDSHRIDNVVINALNQYEYNVNGTWSSNPIFTGLTGGTYTPMMRNISFPSYPISLANVTLVNPVPSAINAGSDITICQGSSTTLNGSSTPPASFSGSVSATYTSGNLPTDYSTGPTTATNAACPANLSVTIPAGATITSVNVAYSMTAQNAGYMSEQRTYLQCTSSGGVKESSIYSGVGGTGGTYSYSRTGLNIANGVTGGGTVNFSLHAFRTWGSLSPECQTYYNQVNNNTFTITVFYSVTPTVSYSWSPTTNLSNPNISNPVANPSSTITYTMTASVNGCSGTDNVLVSVDPASIAPTSIAGVTTACHGNIVSLTQTGGTLSSGASYEWFSGSCGGTSLGTGTSISITPSSTTNYYVRASAGTYCPASSCANTTITLPSAGTTLANDAESATCVVNQTGYVHFYHSSGRLLASINSYGQNLGNVDVTAYVGSAANVPACNYPYYESAFMGRRYVITPTTQPSSPVDVILHFDDSELSSLVSVANSNSTGDDDLTVITDLAVSKYSGPNNVDGNAANNCPGAGGSGGATIHSLASSGNTSSLHPGFSSTGRYVGVNINSFSEFWFGGNGATPLATELVQFSATCLSDKKVHLTWSTASEQNCNQYKVLKSQDGIQWDFVESKTCSMNSNELKEYEVTDNSRYEGVSYYRLMELDNDGIETQLRTISVSCENTNGIHAIIYPNPTENAFSLEVNSSKNLEQVTVSLRDMQGKLISEKSVHFGNGTTVVPFEGLNLSPGTYFIHFEGIENQLKPIKVLIQK